MGYKFPDIESELSVWSEQVTASLYGYTDPLTGWILVPSVAVVINYESLLIWGL